MAIDRSWPLLSRKQASEYLGVKKGTLDSWAWSGVVKLPYVKVGRRAMYRQSDLDAFVAQNVRGG